MKKALCLILIMTVSCTEAVIYRNDSYTLFADNVTQGEYVAVAETPHRIVSNFGVPYISDHYPIVARLQF